MFYLGTHIESWLSRLDVPLFVSRRRLEKRKRMPRALGRWALDSGGFSELTMFGGWKLEPEAYADFVRRCQAEIGNLDWAATMDWMCEPAVIHGGRMGYGQAVGTKLSVEEHQRRTVQNAVVLEEIAPDVPWTPVIQGWEIHEYYRHVDMYSEAGIDLRDRSTVGVGSVCRRGHTVEIEAMFRELADYGLKLHGFGIKTKAAARCRSLLQSADSLAWSYAGRRSPPLSGHNHKNCANCVDFALLWRRKIIDLIDLEKSEHS